MSLSSAHRQLCPLARMGARAFSTAGGAQAGRLTGM